MHSQILTTAFATAAATGIVWILLFRWAWKEWADRTADRITALECYIEEETTLFVMPDKVEALKAAITQLQNRLDKINDRLAGQIALTAQTTAELHERIDALTEDTECPTQPVQPSPESSPCS